MSARRRRFLLAAVGVLTASGCAGATMIGAPIAEEPTPPPLAVEPVEVAPLPVPLPTPFSSDPLAGIDFGEPITLSAVDVDVRALIPALAEAAGLSLVMGPEVQGRVSVNLIEVPALEALAVILTEAGLMIAPAPVTSPWGPVVFYTLPVNIWTADAELIQRRYRVTAEMAKWIVESRLP